MCEERKSKSALYVPISIRLDTFTLLSAVDALITLWLNIRLNMILSRLQFKELPYFDKESSCALVGR